MNSKEHVIRLAQLERELRQIPDDTFAALVAKLDEESRKWLSGVAGSGDEVDVELLRGAMKRGRMRGVPEKVATVITDACLNDCVEALADNADLPSEAELAAVTPGLAERHGVPTTRAMFATAVLGEAPASAAILKILKNDPALSLPS